MEHEYGDILQVLMHPDSPEEAFVSSIVTAVADLRLLGADQDIRAFFLEQLKHRLDEMRGQFSEHSDEDYYEAYFAVHALVECHLGLYPEMHRPNL